MTPELERSLESLSDTLLFWSCAWGTLAIGGIMCLIFGAIRIRRKNP